MYTTTHQRIEAEELASALLSVSGSKCDYVRQVRFTTQARRRLVRAASATAGVEFRTILPSTFLIGDIYVTQGLRSISAGLSLCSKVLAVRLARELSAGWRGVGPVVAYIGRRTAVWVDGIMRGSWS